MYFTVCLFNTIVQVTVLIHLLSGSCINKITNKTNLSETSYLQIIAGQKVLGQNSVGQNVLDSWKFICCSREEQITLLGQPRCTTIYNCIIYHNMDE